VSFRKFLSGDTCVLGDLKGKAYLLELFRRSLREASEALLFTESIFKFP
jgi:hypothetical protein